MRSFTKSYFVFIHKCIPSLFLIICCYWIFYSSFLRQLPLSIPSSYQCILCSCYRYFTPYDRGVDHFQVISSIMWNMLFSSDGALLRRSSISAKCPSLPSFLPSSGRYSKILWTNLYISTKNKDNDTKLSGYDPWGLPRSSTLSRMTPSSKCPVRNLQCPPSTPLLDPPPPDTLLIEISAWNFQSIFLGVKNHHSWRQEWPYPPCLRSGTLNVLQVPPFLTPPSWHTSKWDITTKFSGCHHRGKRISFMTSGRPL